MTRRALGGLGAAVLVALALVGFAPEAALARTPSVALSSPANGADLTQPPTVIGQAAMQSGWIDSVKITVQSTQGHTVPAPHTLDPSDNPNPLPFQWAPPLAVNGIYKVTAEAVGRDNIEINGPEVSSVTHTFALNVPPAAPSGVKTVVNQTKRTVTISWAKNPEPDLVGYGVWREDGDELVERGFFTPAQERTFTDDIGALPAGTYKYQVFAARPNATGDGFIPSAPSKTSGRVTSAPPTPSTTTANQSGGGTAATTTTAPGSPSPNLATRGKADLSGFAALLPSGGAKLPTVRSTPAPDPGFDEDLPFDPNAPAATTDAPAMGDDSDQALGEGTLASSSGDEPSGLRFMAAGLLVTVVLMHLLWLRDEVNREPLPAVAVDEPAAPAD